MFQNQNNGEQIQHQENKKDRVKLEMYQVMHLVPEET